MRVRPEMRKLLEKELRNYTQKHTIMQTHKWRIEIVRIGIKYRHTDNIVCTEH